MPKRPQAPKPIFVFWGGVKYNSLNPTFKIDLKKGLDSEDADRRDSMALFCFRSFCRVSDKLYNKPIFSLPNGKTQQNVISKHNHVHVKKGICTQSIYISIINKSFVLKVFILAS